MNIRKTQSDVREAMHVEFIKSINKYMLNKVQLKKKKKPAESKFKSKQFRTLLDWDLLHLFMMNIKMCMVLPH